MGATFLILPMSITTAFPFGFSAKLKITNIVANCPAVCPFLIKLSPSFLQFLAKEIFNFFIFHFSTKLLITNIVANHFCIKTYTYSAFAERKVPQTQSRHTLATRHYYGKSEGYMEQAFIPNRFTTILVFSKIVENYFLDL